MEGRLALSIYCHFLHLLCTAFWFSLDTLTLTCVCTQKCLTHGISKSVSATVLHVQKADNFMEILSQFSWTTRIKFAMKYKIWVWMSRMRNHNFFTLFHCNFIKYWQLFISSMASLMSNILTKSLGHVLHNFLFVWSGGDTAHNTWSWYEEIRFVADI